MGYLNLEEYIRTVPDHPPEGIHFYDPNSLFVSEGLATSCRRTCRENGPCISHILVLKVEALL